ncbi:MAG: prepilin-type N-terminal cleavage/methylation domain-containing protein [Patescibacteria group bacterium]|nr:prepilin-type N-terminal cleavage/methylation domain-containing protein [Patescibacteria group bacterium]MDZ4296279.1 prepilin-type N-terminal cleavage/methylation domain-containing protein [Patescibacteria group bacterium]
MIPVRPGGCKQLKAAARGFSLIEMSVALAVFGLMMIGVMGVFTASIRMYRHADASQTLLDNTRFVLEYMEREMRTGKNFTMPTAEILEFINDRIPAELVRYKHVSGAVGRCVVGVNPCSADENFEAMTAPAVTIEQLDFRLTGQTKTDQLQPRITLVMRASAASDPTVVYHLQTSVSQRELDL